jgi:hypothetical protein
VRFQSQPARALAQAVNCRTLTPEASDLRHFVGICGGQSGSATGISAVLRLFLSASFHQYSILVHLSFVDAFSVGISSLNNTFFFASVEISSRAPAALQVVSCGFHYTRSPFLCCRNLLRRYVILFRDTGEVHRISFSFFFACYFI